MRHKIGNLIVTAIEIGCAVGLTGIAINAEWKRHKAEKALYDVKLKCAIYEFGYSVRCIAIKHLEKELEELKEKDEA